MIPTVLGIFFYVISRHPSGFVECVCMSDDEEESMSAYLISISQEPRQISAGKQLMWGDLNPPNFSFLFSSTGAWDASFIADDRDLGSPRAPAIAHPSNSTEFRRRR
jgi:hypothetical protein